MDAEGAKLIKRIKGLIENNISVIVASHGGNGAAEIAEAGAEYYRFRWLNSEPDELDHKTFVENLSIIKGIIDKKQIDIIEVTDLYPALFVYYLSKLVSIPYLVNFLSIEDLLADDFKYIGFVKEINSASILYAADSKLISEVQSHREITFSNWKVIHAIDSDLRNLINEYNWVIDNFSTNDSIFLNYDDLHVTSNNSYLRFLEDKDKSLVLFGASEFGLYAQDSLRMNNIMVDYFCDNDVSKCGSIISGAAIISPDQLLALYGRVNILITSMYRAEIERQLLHLGFSESDIYFIPREIYGRLSYYKKSQEAISCSCERIAEALDILEDIKSKQVFINIIKHKMSFDFNLINEIIDHEQYFDSSILEFCDHETFVDAGAYDGQTTMEFIAKVKGRFNKAFVFEPDKNMLDKVAGTIDSVNKDNNIKLIAGGVYDKSGVIKFTPGEIGGSHISNNGSENIEIYKLDDVLKDEDVTFIKMDIEGAEMNALIGAQNIIRENKPKLAICTYHMPPQDFWEIPLYIKTLVPEYKIFIRHYGYDVRDTICYAVI